MKTAYSYIRFSNAEQAQGDSLNRQTERAAEYCQRRGWALDTSLSLRDLGVSAFRGMNALTGNFRAFLDAIKGGKVAPGSVLVIESFDRISRQGIDEGYDLVKSILKAGVQIVTLSPEREFDVSATKSLSKGALEIQLILERAAEESERKSDRVGRAWATKQKGASVKAVTRKLPRWIVAKGGEGKKMKDTAPGEVTFAVDEKKATVVRRIFALAIDGHGTTGITKVLNREKVPTIGRATLKNRPVAWTTGTVKCTLTNPAVIGTYIPHRSGRGKPQGEPVTNYFPAVIDEATFYSAQNALKTRAAVGRGRTGKHVNLFAGIIIDARNGGSMTYQHRQEGSIVLPTGLTHGAAVPWTSFPAPTLETALLGKLAELTARDVSGSEDTDASERVKEADGKIAKIDALLGAWEKKMDNPDIVDTVAAKLASLKAERRAAIEEREAARRSASAPAGAALAEVSTLADLLGVDNSDETRTKVRAALRTMIESVTCLFVSRPRSKVRRAAVRVQFRNNKHRDYIITADAGSRGVCPRPATTMTVSAVWPAGGKELDLRKPADAALAEKALAALDLTSRTTTTKR